MRSNLSCFLQWRLNLLLCLAFGWKIARIYIFFLGKVYFYFNRKEKALIEESVLQAVGSTYRLPDSKHLIKRVFYGILSHYYEKLFIAFEEPGKASRFLNRHVISRDLEILEDKLSGGHGVILVTGHYGAIEYLPVLLAINNLPISMIAKFKTKQLRRKVWSRAEEYGIRLIDAKDSRPVIQSAIKELRENRILITQCDEIKAWRPSAKHRLSFLGRRTLEDRTIDVLQKRTGAEIVFGIVHRYSLSKYELILHGYENMQRLLRQPSNSSVAEAVLNILERFIYANPEQWYQWKQYQEIETHPRPAALPVLKAAYDRTS